MVNKFQNFIARFSIRQMILFLIGFVSLILFITVTIWAQVKENRLIDQKAAERWDVKGKSAQVSCFIAEAGELDEFAIVSFEKKMGEMIAEVLPSREEDAGKDKRELIDAYSAMGRITIENQGKKLETQAIGVGGDFFFFHPLKLISGQYFSGNDLMKDYIILDEDAAWQLFGSFDIEGMCVTIGNVPHYVSGVIKKPIGKFEENSGLDKTLIFVSYNTLSQYGDSSKINTYEIVAPNPISKFVYNGVKEKLGIDENNIIVVENSTRYTVSGLIPVILDFGMRSMQNSAVHFPYWENVARGWEDVRALILCLQILLLLIPVLMSICYLIIKWKNRTFTAKDIGNYFLDLKEKLIENCYRKKKSNQNLWEEDNE